MLDFPVSMPRNVFLEALEQIPKGQTRSFMELAAMAGRPGAARAAGRAVAACSSRWRHRVVSANGRPRDDEQRCRLSREGARAKAGESIDIWARRVGARFIGRYGTRELAPPVVAAKLKWRSDELEAFPNEAAARARGFQPVGTPPFSGEPLPPRQTVIVEPGLARLEKRLDRINWDRARTALRASGIHRMPKLIAPSECQSILDASAAIERFERTIQMLPKGYGVGTYHYYTEPLPEPAGELRERLYRELALSGYPNNLAAFWKQCRDRGQKRASSILICYGKGGVNYPHRDVYGQVWFPFQALVMLSRRGRDFTGGEFFVEDEASGHRQIARVSEGDVVLFATRERVQNGSPVAVRHGMLPVTRGKRYAFGVVFHLAE